MFKDIRSQSPEIMRVSFQCTWTSCFQDFRILEFQNPQVLRVSQSLCLEVLRVYVYLTSRLITSSPRRGGRQTHLHERLKSGIRADLEQVPQERYWCGAWGELSPLVDSFPSKEDEPARQEECQKDGEAPSQLHGAWSGGVLGPSPA